MTQNNGFTQNADLFRTSDAHRLLADLQQALEQIPSVAGQECLDVATGTGHTALYLAEKFAHVFAVDINDQMMRVAQEESDRKSLSVRFLKSPAEELNFDDETFDLVSCRLAAHHFTDCQAFLAEAFRVLRNRGHLVLIDNTVPEAGPAADWINDFEARRDPTHQRCLTATEWDRLLKNQGLTKIWSDLYPNRMAYEPWMARMGVESNKVESMWQELLQAPDEVQQFWTPENSSEGQRFVTLRRLLLVAQKA